MKEKVRPNRFKPVIYKIWSISNPSRFYIGSTIYFNSRKLRHINDLSKNIHSNTIFRNHVNKYGINDIIFEIIEYVDLESNLITREQYYLDTLKPTLNVRKIADSNLGVKKTEEQKKWHSINNPRYWKGKTHTAEVKEKIAKSKKGVKVHSKENKEKVSLRMIGNSYNLGRKLKAELIERRKIAYHETIKKRRKTKLNPFKLSLPKLKIYRRIFNGEVQNNLVREYKVCKKTIQRIKLFYQKEIDYKNCFVKDV